MCCLLRALCFPPVPHPPASICSSRIKFKITAVVQKETKQEQAVTRTQVNEDRKLFLQALIVRIMKARKQLDHNNLITEVIGQAKDRFPAKVSLIKRQVEHLIEKEFLRRDEESPQTYIYVA